MAVSARIGSAWKKFRVLRGVSYEVGFIFETMGDDLSVLR